MLDDEDEIQSQKRMKIEEVSFLVKYRTYPTLVSICLSVLSSIVGWYVLMDVIFFRFFFIADLIFPSAVQLIQLTLSQFSYLPSVYDFQ